MKFSFKPTFTQCIVICILFIVIGLFIANYFKPSANSANINTTDNKQSSSSNTSNENYKYPYYPHIYQSVPEYIYQDDLFIRNQGNGDLLVWNKNPIMPLLVKYRQNNFQSDVCKFIRGNQPIYFTTP